MLLTFCLLLLPLRESVIVLCFCCTLLYVHSSFAIILMGKRELVALLSLSSWCLMMVVWLFLAVPWVCLRFVIVVFPDHIHLPFLIDHMYWNILEVFAEVCFLPYGLLTSGIEYALLLFLFYSAPLNI